MELTELELFVIWLCLVAAYVIYLNKDHFH